MGNIFAIGDIHGEFFKLDKLIERLSPGTNDVLVFLGDYIDRGQYTFEVIDFLLELARKFTCVFLKGNHEEMFMNYLSGIDEDLFLYNGGGNTVKSYARNGYDISLMTFYNNRNMPPSHMEFFKSLKLYHETEEYIFVHAGIAPGVPLARTPENLLLWDRYFNYSSFYEGKVVVYGHTPGKVLNEECRICIDTGACFEGRDTSLGFLTGVKLPERTFYKQGTVIEDLVGW